jgi:hypothetical protein
LVASHSKSLSRRKHATESLLVDAPDDEVTIRASPPVTPAPHERQESQSTISSAPAFVALANAQSVWKLRLRIVRWRRLVGEVGDDCVAPEATMPRHRSGGSAFRGGTGGL